jgi:hypothetical protein
MDKNQIIELWRSLSPRLARAIPGEELRKDEDTDEEKRYGDKKRKRLSPLELIMTKVMFRKGTSNG